MIESVRSAFFGVFKKTINRLHGRGIGAKFPVLFRFYRSVFFKIHPTVAKVQGHIMFLDQKDSLGLSVFEFYEPFETEVMKNLVKRGDVVVDLGANIGYYTLIFAKLVGAEGKVFAFEPDITNFSLLKKNVEVNGYKNVVLVNKAVSNENGIIKLYLSEDGIGAHSILNKWSTFTKVETTQLDEYFKNYAGKIDLIKMDIEGAELKALKGMKNILKKNNDVAVITEFWRGKDRSRQEAQEQLDLLRSFDFKIFELNSETNKQELIKNDATWLENYDSKKSTNILCTRG